MRGRRCARRSRSGRRQRLNACAAPAPGARHPGLGRRRGSARGHYDPPARSWLTWMCSPSPGGRSPLEWGRNRGPVSQEIKSKEQPPSAKCAARRREPAPACPTESRHGTTGKSPRWSAGRRAGPRYGPVISGRSLPEMGSTARRATGAPVRAPASSGAPSPLAFARGEPKEARPARHRPTGRRSVGCLTIEEDAGGAGQTVRGLILALRCQRKAPERLSRGFEFDRRL